MSPVREITPKEEGLETRESGRAVRPLANSLEEFFENLFPRRWMEPMNLRRSLFPELEMKFEAQWPRMDVIDRDNELMIRAELPGVKKEDLEITITDDDLRLSAFREMKKEEKGETMYRSEIQRGSFQRFVPFPMEVDSEKAKAALKDGVLEIMIPKRKATKRHQVEIK
jgi:HSP20 family protein